MSSIELDIPPGLVTAFLFVALDIFTVGLLDVVLARIVCLVYYRNIQEGYPVPVTSADIPGISNYLLGSRLAPINVIATVVKFLLLGVVLTANISIETALNRTDYRTVNATFSFNSSDALATAAAAPSGATYRRVRDRPERSKECVLALGNDTLVYYALRFNLRDGAALNASTDVTTDAAEVEMFDVDDRSVVCTRPGDVPERDTTPLLVVERCTDTGSNGSCSSVVSATMRHNISKDYVTSEKYDGLFPWSFHDYNESEVRAKWTNYSNPTLTCLSMVLGAENGDHQSATYVHCLMVSFESQENMTYVERWVLGSKENIAGRQLIMEYAGPVLRGNIPIGRMAAARYLQYPFPYTDYRTLSGELVAQAALYQFDRREIGVLSDSRATKVGYYAVGLVAIAIITVFIAYVAIIMTLRTDRRPWFNAIDGLSSIRREENEPSGRTYEVGKTTRLGFSYCDDILHFGPLRSKVDSAPFRNEYEIS